MRPKFDAFSVAQHADNHLIHGSSYAIIVDIITRRGQAIATKSPDPSLCRKQDCNYRPIRSRACI